ncbi:MAG TPA: hypothetical protein VII98_04580 [Solirubrobacteraceae bacterium]
MSERCWLALVDAAPSGADAAAALRTPDGAPAGWLAAWIRASKPVRDARRADPRIVDQDGAPATISLVLPERDALTIFDDPAVQGARRAVLADAEPADLVTTLLVDASHFAGSLTARRGPDALSRLRDDPFLRVWAGRLLVVDAGLLGSVPAPPGPVIERHGSDVPWPGGGFPAPGQ